MIHFLERAANVSHYTHLWTGLAYTSNIIPYSNGLDRLPPDVMTVRFTAEVFPGAALALAAREVVESVSWGSHAVSAAKIERASAFIFDPLHQ